MKRVCVLTGASGLLGTAFLESCRDRYDVVAVHLTSPLAVATREQTCVDPLEPGRVLDANRDPVLAVRADLSTQEGVDTAITAALAAFGHVDLLINAAAIRRFAPLVSDGTEDHATDLFALNLLAPLKLSLALARRVWMADPAMNSARNRNVINISSTAGLYVYPDTGQALYAASKAALNHLTYHLASEFWDLGVRVNAIAPNTFPAWVDVQTVIDSIVALDAGVETGQVVALDADA